MGVERVTQFCAAHEDVGALMTIAGTRAGTVELVAIGLDDDEWRRL